MCLPSHAISGPRTQYRDADGGAKQEEGVTAEQAHVERIAEDVGVVQQQGHEHREEDAQRGYGKADIVRVDVHRFPFCLTRQKYNYFQYLVSQGTKKINNGFPECRSSRWCSLAR